MTETFKVNDLIVKIINDDNFESPRDWDNVGTIVCWHSRYNLGDEQPRETPEEYRDEYVPDTALTLPLYLYDHSGITMRTSPFSCPWDSGQVGFIYAPKGFEGMTDEMILKCLETEVKTYDQYLTGDVWGYQIDAPEEDCIESCWGFYGEDVCIQEAKDAANGCLKTRRTARYERLKTLIRARVPLMVRERELRV